MNRGGNFLIKRVDEDRVFSREHFSEEHRMFTEAVREFGRDRIHPVKDELNVLNTELTREVFQKWENWDFWERNALKNMAAFNWIKLPVLL